MSVKTFEVGEDEEGMRLDRWFKRRMPTLSLSHLNKIVRTGEVRVDGARVMSATRLVKGQRVRVPPLKLDAPVALAREISPTDLRALQDMILYEDRDLLVLDKPFGLAVQGGSGMTRHIDGMLASMPNERGDRPVLVHRLDRDTSGVLLVAKTRSIAADLGEIFRSRQARKIYWALVEACPSRRKAASPFISQKVRAWARPGWRGVRKRGAENLKRCVSPGMATRMPAIR